MDDNIVVIVEDTQTKLQSLLSTMVNDRIKRDIIGNEAKQIITNCIKILNDLGCEREFVEKQRQAFMTTFLNWYMRITANLAKLAQKTKNPTFYQSYTEIVGVEPKISGKSMIISLGQNDFRAGEGNNSQNIEIGGIKNIRDFFTTGETGYSQMFVEDYQKRVNQEIMRIANQNVVLVNRKGRAISARNLAEMQVRYEEQVKDMERLKEKGAKFVVATSHANASTRCQPWQGKIYILDAEVGSVAIKDNHYDGEPKPIGKTQDGKDYYSLKEAMIHGFLGYNCRHRLILYKPGMIMPKQYTTNQVSKERSIETTARSLERQIRVAKKKSMLANNSLDRKKYQEQSKMLQDTYWQYCKEHDYPVAEWRIRVSLTERELINNKSFKSNVNVGIISEKPVNNSYIVNEVSEERYILNFESKYDWSKKIYEELRIKCSNKFTFIKDKNNNLHALERHPEILKKVPNYLEIIENTINNPINTYIAKSEQYGENNISLLIPLNKKERYIRIGFIMSSTENRIKSFRYITLKDNKKNKYLEKEKFKLIVK